MKVVILDGHAINPGDLSWDALRGLGELEVFDRTPEHAIVARGRSRRPADRQNSLLVNGFSPLAMLEWRALGWRAYKPFCLAKHAALSSHFRVGSTDPEALATPYLFTGQA